MARLITWKILSETPLFRYLSIVDVPLMQCTVWNFPHLLNSNTVSPKYSLHSHKCWNYKAFLVGVYLEVTRWLLDLSINILDYSSQFTDRIFTVLKWLQGHSLLGWTTPQLISRNSEPIWIWSWFSEKPIILHCKSVDWFIREVFTK